MSEGEEERGSLRKSLRVVMQDGPFRRYMMGECVSTTGSWMQIMADQWVMTGLTSSPFMMGLVTFASGIPVLLLTPIGGSSADKFDKRNILLVTQVAQILLALVMAVLVYLNVVQIWMVIAVAACLGVVNAFEMPAASALVPELVPKEHLGDAMAVDRSSFHTTRLVGPGLAGILIGVFGAAIAYFLNALSFIALMVALKTIPPREQGDAEEEEARGSGIKDGLAYVRRDPVTGAMIAMMALMTFVPMPLLMVLLPLYARTELHLGATGMGLMMSINACGSLIGSIWLLGVAPSKRLGRLTIVSVGVALGILGMATITMPLLAAVCLFCMSLCLASTFGLVNTIIQERVPNHLRGRVSALTGMCVWGLQPFTALGVSYLASIVGLTHAMWLGAPLYAVLAMVILLGPARMKVQPQPTPEPIVI